MNRMQQLEHFNNRTVEELRMMFTSGNINLDINSAYISCENRQRIVAAIGFPEIT